MKLQNLIVCLIALTLFTSGAFARDIDAIWGTYVRTCIEVSYGPYYKEYMNQTMQISKDTMVTKATVFSDDNCKNVIRKRLAEAKVQSFKLIKNSSWKIASELKHVLMTSLTQGDAEGLRQSLCGLDFKVNVPLDASICLKIRGKVENRRYTLLKQELTVGTSKYRKVE